MPRSETGPNSTPKKSISSLLREIGREVELRVVVDIIAGASAGGINGAMLARALTHDLSMDALRDLWLENADVAILLSSDARAGTWSKWFLQPFIWAAAATGRFKLIKDMEVRQKLSLFVRSRWFRPPLDGQVMAGLMYDAVTSMGAAKNPAASLLPSGQSFDLFVTVTDFYGYHALVQIHDPPLIHELDHHHVLHFNYRRRSSGEVESDFDLDNAPGLAFAARATSSFPGAFPPARIVEMDDVVARRQGIWPRRSRVHCQMLPEPSACGHRSGHGVLSRWRGAQQQALSAGDCGHSRQAGLSGSGSPRRLYRSRSAVAGIRRVGTRSRASLPPCVARSRTSPAPSRSPTSFLVCSSSTSRYGACGRSSTARVLMSASWCLKVVTTTFDEAMSANDLRNWREQVNSHVALDAGFAYQAYVRLKLASVRAFGADLIAKLRGVPAQSPMSRVVAEIIDVWALRKGIVYERTDGEALEFEPQDTGHLPAWVNYLRVFDVKYRERRVHFLIEGQNRLYQLLGQERFSGLDPLIVDRLKRDFYRRLDLLRRREDVRYYSREVRDLVADIFPATPSGADVRHLHSYAKAFADQHADKLDRLIEQLGVEIDLDASTRDLDELLASLDPAQWHPEARREVLVNYLGFPFWDVLTFPITSAREIGELNEILIDRISPQDARALKGFDGIESLKGVGFGHFAAFLSRAYRENDYLLGRLHALDRLIDIVCDSAGIDFARHRIDVLALKKRGFARVLDVEERHLTHSKQLIAALRRTVAEMDG